VLCQWPTWRDLSDEKSRSVLHRRIKDTSDLQIKVSCGVAFYQVDTLHGNKAKRKIRP
jgi:hypothetical protein